MWTSIDWRGIPWAKISFAKPARSAEFTLEPLCDYRAGTAGDNAAGVVFTAEIHRLGDMPEREMAETRLFDALPENLSYPAITPKLFRCETR